MCKYRTFALCLLCGGIALVGCGASSSGEFEIETENVVNDISFEDSEITIPVGLVGNEVSEDKIVSVDSTSGDVTYALTGSERSDIVRELASEIDDSINVILADDEYYPDVDSISYNDDYSEFNIVLEDGQANIYESMLSMSFYTIGNKYQIYYGTKASDAITTVVYTNSSTGEVVASGDSSSMTVN
jgi:hypothetical protein